MPDCGSPVNSTNYATDAGTSVLLGWPMVNRRNTEMCSLNCSGRSQVIQLQKTGWWRL